MTGQSFIIIKKLVSYYNLYIFTWTFLKYAIFINAID